MSYFSIVVFQLKRTSKNIRKRVAQIIENDNFPSTGENNSKLVIAEIVVKLLKTGKYKVYNIEPATNSPKLVEEEAANRSDHWPARA